MIQHSWQLDVFFSRTVVPHDRWLECSLLLAPKGLLLEFGTFRGRSLRRLCRVTKKHVYGFDSYQGLPEDWNDEFKTGAFATTPPPPERIPENGSITIGDVRDTLPVFLDEPARLRKKVAFVHFDMDVYVSTKAALDLLTPRLAPGCIFLFDEIYDRPGNDHNRRHEGQAFRDWINETGAKVEFVGRRHHEAWSFRVFLPDVGN